MRVGGFFLANSTKKNLLDKPQPLPYIITNGNISIRYRYMPWMNAYDVDAMDKARKELLDETEFEGLQAAIGNARIHLSHLPKCSYRRKINNLLIAAQRLRKQWEESIEQNNPH